MRIEELGGKAASRQRSLGGFETEDVLYLFPLFTLHGRWQRSRMMRKRDDHSMVGSRVSFSIDVLVPCADEQHE